MQLGTERLLIRDMTHDDFAGVYAYQSDLEVGRYMYSPPSSPESTRDDITLCMATAQEQPRHIYDLGVILKSTGELIGGIGLHVTDPTMGEAVFYYKFNRTYWGHGYATEALKRMVRFGFEQLGLSRLSDGCDIANSASARVMEKCGFCYLGEHDGEYLYALTTEEWQRWAP